MKKFNPIIPVQDDGLTIFEVGEWAEKKYNLFGAYADIFTSSMHRKWHNLVYIDLFSKYPDPLGRGWLFCIGLRALL